VAESPLATLTPGAAELLREALGRLAPALPLIENALGQDTA
jgi:hypothetical protein